MGTFTGSAGTFRQRTELTERRRDIVHALIIGAPPRICRLESRREAVRALTSGYLTA